MVRRRRGSSGGVRRFAELLGAGQGLSPWEKAWAERPLLRGWLHAGALPVALGATALLTARRRRHRTAVAAYGAGLCAMLATSAGYHRLTRTESQYRWTQPADHVMIFAAIAGSATPVAAAVLPPRAVRPAIAALWSGAAVGAFGRLWDLRRGTSIGTVAYLALGWSGLAMLPSVVRRHGVRVGALLTGGGVAYSVGAGLFAAKRPNPFPNVFGYHEVWHTATLVGAALHLAAIAEITRDGHHGDDTEAPLGEPATGQPGGRRRLPTTELVPADVVDDDVAGVTATIDQPPEAPRVPVIT